jgi:hypothetical protein
MPATDRAGSRLTVIVAFAIVVGVLAYVLPKIFGSPAPTTPTTPAPQAGTADATVEAPLQTTRFAGGATPLPGGAILEFDFEPTATPNPVSATVTPPNLTSTTQSALGASSAPAPVRTATRSRPTATPRRSAAPTLPATATATPQTAAADAPGTFSVDITSAKYSSSGFPKQGCVGFDEATPVRRFDFVVNVTNNGDAEIGPSDWGAMAMARTRRLLLCFYGGDALPNIPSKQTRTATFTAFVFPGESVTNIFVGTNGGSLAQFCTSGEVVNPC